MSNINQILYALRNLQPYLNKVYSVSSLEIFGSFVRHEQNNNSDLDILVSFNKVPGIIKFLELKNFLSDKLNINVDLVMKDSLKPGIRQNILSESIPV